MQEHLSDWQRELENVIRMLHQCGPYEVTGDIARRLGRMAREMDELEQSAPVAAIGEAR